MTTQTPGRGDTLAGREGDRPGPGRSWQIRIPFTGQWLTTSKTSSYRWGRKDWRNATSFACRQAQLPKSITARVDIHAVCWWVGRSAPVREWPNLSPTIKAIVDGLVPTRIVTRQGKPHTRGGYGLLVDDTDKHRRNETWELKRSPTGQAWVDLTITEVLDATS